MDLDLNIKVKTLKFLEENLCDLGENKYLLESSQKAIT